MKITDYLAAAFSNIKAEKKKAVLLTFIMSVGLVMLILTGSLEESINEYLDVSIFQMIPMRSVLVLDDKLFEKLKDDENVEDTYYSVGLHTVTFANSEELINHRSDLLGLSAYTKAYDKYLVTGRGIENKNEIILPKYLMDYGDLYGSNYIDMEKYLGKTVVLEWNKFNPYTDEQLEKVSVEFVVVGVADNMATPLNGALIDDEYLCELKNQQIVNDKSNEELIIFKLYQLGYDESYLDDIDNIFGQHIFVNNVIVYKDASAKDKILEKYEGSVYGMGDVDSVFKLEVSLIAMCFKLFALIILLIVFVNIVITIIHNIADKEWDFALKIAMGYSIRKISVVIVVEYIFIALVSFILSMGMSAGLLKIMKDALVKYFVFLMAVDINIKLSVAMTALGICVLAIITAYVTARFRIGRINITRALKLEDFLKKGQIKKKLSKKAKIIIGAVSVSAVILFCIYLYNSMLIFERNHKKANEDVRYISIEYREYDESIEKYVEKIFVTSDKDDIETFVEGVPKIKAIQSVGFNLVQDFISVKYERDMTILMIYNVRDDNGVLQKDTLGMQYNINLINDDTWLCNYITNNGKYGSTVGETHYRLNVPDIRDYVYEYIADKTKILTFDELKSVIDKAGKNGNKLGIEEFGMYYYEKWENDSGLKFGLNDSIEKGISNQRIVIEIDKTYSLYVYFSKGTYSAEMAAQVGGTYFDGYETNGIFLYNANTEEYINLLKDTDIEEFLSKENLE